MAALRILLELAGHQSVESIKPEPHISGAGGHKYARGRAQAEHTLHRLPQAVAQRHTVERRDQPPQLCRIEARLDLDTKTLSEHDPKLPARFLACGPHRVYRHRATRDDLDGDNLYARSKLCYAPAPRIKRMHAQPMRRRKLLASQSALHELRNQPVCFCPVPSAHPCTHSVRIHASTSTQFKSKRKNGVARMHTDRRRYYLLRLLLPCSRKTAKEKQQQKQPHRCAEVDSVTPYQSKLRVKR